MHSKTQFIDSFYAALAAADFEKKLISPDLEESFWAYYQLSLKWAEKINITRNLSLEAFISENLCDPLFAIQKASERLFEGPNCRFADLGCGGGYVGIVWLLWLFSRDQNHSLTLVDSDRKKINFCKTVARELGVLDFVEAHQMRVEDWLLQESLSQDLIVSRATWDWPKMRSLMVPIEQNISGIAYFASEDVVKSLNLANSPELQGFDYQVIKGGKAIFRYLLVEKISK